MFFELICGDGLGLMFDVLEVVWWLEVMGYGNNVDVSVDVVVVVMFVGLMFFDFVYVEEFEVFVVF